MSVVKNKLILPQKTTFMFSYPALSDNVPIVFDSTFDSGNCSLVEQLDPNKVLFIPSVN